MDLRTPTFISFSRSEITSSTSTANAVVNHPIRQRSKPANVKRRVISADNYQQQYAPSKLLSLCRQQQWDAILERCQTHPDEAIPKQQQREIYSSSITTKRDRLSSTVPNTIIAINRPTHLLYQPTPLGVLCCEGDNGDEAESSSELHVPAIEALVRACPSQICASQGIRGHTPLRDICRGSRNSIAVLDILLSTQEGIQAASLQDEQGLTPLDHVMLRMTMMDSVREEKLLYHFVHFVPCLVQGPLIRLLSLNSSGCSTPIDRTTASADMDSSSSSNNNKNSKLDRMVTMVRTLLDKNPDWLFNKSITSGCTVLHIALRAFGNSEPLIRLLLDRDPENAQLAKRNVFGDLPLHVACAVGVPMSILHSLLERTPCDLVWTTNSAGYTPIDLEWMRHMEGGLGLWEGRRFYPLEERGGIRPNSPRQEALYRHLLRNAVEQVIGDKQHGNDNDASTEHPQRQKHLGGAVLDRMMVVIQFAAACGGSSRSNLHSVCRLVNAAGPTLPEPLVRLFLHLHPNQLRERDSEGRLPLHHAFIPTHHTQQQRRDMFNDASDMPKREEYNKTVMTLLKVFPKATRIFDKTSRLPLHYALLHHNLCDGNNNIIRALVHEFPDSVEHRDPETGLYPFLLAAPTTTCCYDLLRRAPALVQQQHQSLPQS